MFKLFLRLMLGESGTISEGRTIDESGVTPPAAEPTPTPPAGDKAKPPAQPDNGVAPAGEGQEQSAGQAPAPQPAAPKYGEFGDDPDKVFEALQQLRGKTTATERNMAALNKTLESAGVKAVKSGDGFQLVPIHETPAQKRERRFNDQHKQYFEDSHIQGIIALAQDTFEDMLEAREKQSFERQSQVNQWNQMKAEANDLMIEMYPSLKPDFDKDGKPQNPAFNESFYNRATEIWQEKYKNDPRGEFKAAREAANEMKVDFRQIEAAKKEGFVAGQKNRTVVGPVTSGTGGSASSGKKLSKSEYLNLSPEDREKYDKNNKGIGS
jgi:hypothetical protein